jgi:hypothetical protein
MRSKLNETKHLLEFFHAGTAMKVVGAGVGFINSAIASGATIDAYWLTVGQISAPITSRLLCL